MPVSPLPVAELIACPDCGALQELPPIASGRLICRRCRATLERATGRSRSAALAFAAATLVLLIPADTMLLMSVSRYGLHGTSYIGSGVALIWRQGWPATAIVVGLLVLVLPLVRFALLVVSLAALTAGLRGRWIGRCFRYAESLDLWAMPDVFLIGCAIGYSRLAPFASVRIGAGGWCFVGAALMAMLTRGVTERRRVWRMMGVQQRSSGDGAFGCPGCQLVVPAESEGGRCPRCAHRLDRHRPGAVSVALALTVAGLLLYPLATFYPVNYLRYFAGGSSHTLFSAVGRLIGAHLFLLAASVFTTSILIPFVKLAGVLWFVASVHRRSIHLLVFKTRFYRAIDELGRWSAMDVFTVVVYAPMVQFGQLANVHVGLGLPALLAVVVLTVAASRCFDPRLLWEHVGP